MIYDHNNINTEFLNNGSKTSKGMPNIVSANQSQVNVHASNFM